MASRRSRRAVLASLGTGLSIALAGCEGTPLGGGGGDGDTIGLGGSAGAAAWPFHRGTAGNTGASASGGPSADATAAFTAELRDGISVGNRPPIVGTDGIYGIAREAEPYSHDPIQFAQYAYKLSTDDGGELWRTTVAKAEGGDKIQQIMGAQGCLGPNNLYALRYDTNEAVQTVTAVSSRAGSVQWEQTIENTAMVRQPVVRDGTLYHFAAGHVVALDTADGSEKWRSPEILYDQPLPSVGANGIAVYNRGVGGQSTGGQLTVLEPATGKVRWSKPLSNARHPIPAVAGDTVYLADGDALGQFELGPGDSRPRRKIHALSTQDGSERWTHTYETDAIDDAFTAGGTAYVTVTPNYVYYALGFLGALGILGPRASSEQVEKVRKQLYHGPNVVALHRDTGSVAWRTTLGSQARVFRPMVAGPDNLYALYRDVDNPEERTKVYALNRHDGSVRGSFGPVQPNRSFAVVDGTLYTHRQGSIRAWR